MMQTPLKRVKGLGAAHKGTGHWLAQRLSAVVLAILGVWFVTSITALIGADFQTLHAWVGDPFAAVLLVSLILALFYHLKLGLEVVIEDYVHNKALKVLSLMGVAGGCWLLAILGVLSVIKISLGS